MAYCFFQKSDPLYQRSFCVSNYYPFLPTAIYINLYLLSCSTSFFFPKMGHSKKIVLFLKPDPFLQKIFRMQPTTWYNWFFNPKTVLFLQNLIHWLTSIDQILTTQSYNSLPSLLLCLASSTTRQPWLLCPFSSFIALICDNFEAAASGCCIAEGIAKCGSLTTTEHKWSIHQKTHSSSSSQLGYTSRMYS